MLEEFAVILSYQADEDFRNILNYISSEYENGYFSAEVVRQKIWRRLKELKLTPESGKIVENEKITISGLRMAHVQQYNIYYTVHKRKKLVWIEAIRHARQKPRLD